MKVLTRRSSCVALQVSCSGRLPSRPEETSPEGAGSHCQESDGSTWGHKGVFETGKMKSVCHCSGSRINQADEPALQQLARVNISPTRVGHNCGDSALPPSPRVRIDAEAMSRRHRKLQTESDWILVWGTGLSLLLLSSN